MTFVKECDRCGHTGHAILQQSGGQKWKDEIDGERLMSTCKVPVQVRAPNNPGLLISMPCGCTGSGPAMKKPEPTPLPELVRCFNPTCEEFALLTSNFCSEACKEAVAAILSGKPPMIVEDDWMDEDIDAWMDA
jgi:hypothetical protein